MRDIFIIGSRGLPAQYGGFETFVEELVKHQQTDHIKYHVACLSDKAHGAHFDYEGADCFTVNPPKLGPARVIAYDMMALKLAFDQVKAEKMKAPIFYILGNTIGAFMTPFARQIQKLGGRLYVNPDGLEWRRSKWSRPVQAYLKYAEKVMAQKADLVIADNGGIESYIQKAYPLAKTTCIAYGTDLGLSQLTASSSRVREFFQTWQLTEGNYYLIVGRFVPENNYETMIHEFMASRSRKDLVIICNHQGSAYFDRLREATGFDTDARIKFVGTVYDKDLLAYIREQAHAYLHGHEVGGTNPGLLEALSHTNLNLVLGVDFNREVADQTAYYWSKEQGSLRKLLETYDEMTDFSDLGRKAKALMADRYSWSKIVAQYEDLFVNEG